MNFFKTILDFMAIHKSKDNVLCDELQKEVQ